MVSWHDALAYCQWLNDLLKGKLPPNTILRLPTEAEWEKAARWRPSPSGRGQGEGLIYPWGNTFDKNKCNTVESGIRGTTPVGKYSPQGDSPYGCADMSGNVWEWCSDWHDAQEYKNRAGKVVKDPQGPTNGQYRALRGGAWYNNLDLARASFRFDYYPHYRYGNIGFRVVAFALPS
jgi:iron(II)-dependent oxidoreductase